MSPAITTGVPVVLDAVADARVHRSVVGRCRHDPHAALVEHDALEVLGHLDAGVPGQVVVVGQPVGDVRGERGQEAVDHRRGAGRADDPQRASARRW